MYQCHVCSRKAKGLTYYKFYTKGDKVLWKTEGEGLIVIRDSKAICLDCARVGNPENLKMHNFTWKDGTVSAWKKRPSKPFHEIKCDCGFVECFRLKVHAKEKGWKGTKCKKCQPKKRIRELEEEVASLKAKLAKIRKLSNVE